MRTWRVHRVQLPEEPGEEDEVTTNERHRRLAVRTLMRAHRVARLNDLIARVRRRATVAKDRKAVVRLLARYDRLTQRLGAVKLQPVYRDEHGPRLVRHDRRWVDAIERRELRRELRAEIRAGEFVQPYIGPPEVLPVDDEVLRDARKRKNAAKRKRRALRASGGQSR